MSSSLLSDENVSTQLDKSNQGSTLYLIHAFGSMCPSLILEGAGEQVGTGTR